MKRSGLLLTSMLMFFFLGSDAQVVLPRGLEKPIRQALQKSKEIQNKELDLEKLAMDKKSVLSKYIPRVNATAGYAYIDNHIIIDLPGYKLPVTGAELFAGKSSIDNNLNAVHGGVMAQSVLFSGMQIQNGARAMEQKRIGDSLLIETDRDNLIIDVVISFDKLRYIEASEKLIRDSESRLAVEEERVNRAIENGLAVPFDRDKIKLARLELESKKMELQESKDLLFNKITWLTDLSDNEIRQISYELQPIVLPQGITADQKQELQALSAYKKASEYVLKKEKGSFLPQAAAFAGVSYTSLFNGSSQFHLSDLPAQTPQPHIKLNEFSMAPTMMAGVVLKWQIFGGTERKNKIKQAELNIRQLENKLEDSRDKLNLLLSQKMLSYQNKFRQIDLAAQQQHIAQNTLTLAEKQYRQGLISVNQRLEAENDFVKSEQHHTEILTDQRRAALEAAAVAGKLSEQIQYKN